MQPCFELESFPRAVFEESSCGHWLQVGDSIPAADVFENNPGNKFELSSLFAGKKVQPSCPGKRAFQAAS